MAATDTVQLGQFTDENAERIVDLLEEAGITWWVKRSGGLARVMFAGDWGVRVFVDVARADEASAIARQVLED